MYALRTMQRGAHEKTPVVAGVWFTACMSPPSGRRAVSLAHAAFHPLRCFTTLPSLCSFLMTEANSPPKANVRAEVGCHPKVRSALRISFFIVSAFHGCCVCLLVVVTRMHLWYRQIVERSTVLQKYFGKLSKNVRECKNPPGGGQMVGCGGQMVGCGGQMVGCGGQMVGVKKPRCCRGLVGGLANQPPAFAASCVG